MKIRPSALFVLALFCSSIFSLAQRPNSGSGIFGGTNSSHDLPMRGAGIISGTVHDMGTAPLKNVRVELTDSNGQVVNAIYTSPSGSFEFSGVNPGIYVVVATAGLAQVRERIDATPGVSVVNLNLASNDRPDDGVQGNSISVAQYKVPGKARDEYRKARTAMEKEKLDEAVKHLEKALAICPDYADALTMRAILDLNEKNAEAAMDNLDKAVKADANYAMAYLVMGSALNMQSKFDEAIRALQRGESLAPNSWQAHFEMAKAYIGKNDYPTALSRLQRARNLAPSEYPLIYLLQAHALLAMKQYPEAMTALQAYLQREPAGPNRAEAQKMLQQAQAFVAKKSD
jgi:thioredoxin-like negative regulator of GroEL